MAIQRLKGSADAVLASYETVWSRVRDNLKSELKTGDHLSSILARTGRLDLGPLRGGVWRANKVAFPVAEAILKGVGSEKPTSKPYHPTVASARYAVSSDINNYRYLARYLTDSTNVIMELGSGWGANLFSLYTLLGRKRCSTITFIAGEYTESGLECSNLLAKYEGEIKLKTSSFDFCDPDFSILDSLPRPRNVALFTSHAIEQVPYISEVLVDQLIEKCDTLIVFHFEPVGWQRIPDLLNARKREHNQFFREIETRLTSDLNSERRQLENSAWWSWRHHYNVNLLSVLKNHQMKKCLKIEHVVYDYAAHNFFNPSTLIRWSPVKSEGVLATESAGKNSSGTITKVGRRGMGQSKRLRKPVPDAQTAKSQRPSDKSP